MSFEKLKEKGVKGVKVNIQYVGYNFDLRSIISDEQLKDMTQEQLEQKLMDYKDKLGEPRVNISLES